MAHQFKFTFLISFTTVLACGGKQGASISETDCETSSVEGYRTIVQDDITREYILHTPSGYDGSSAVPLVIAFHGNGGCADQFASTEAQLASTADSSGFLLAYPQGIARAKGGTEWDPGDDGTTNISTNDLAFTDAIIADISSAYSVEPSQIYAVGYSNGGMMAYGLACRRGAQIAAAAIMSGTMLPGECDAENYTSILHFHGTADDALPYNGNQEYQSIADVMSFWVSHNGISNTSPATTDLGGGVTKDEYTGGSEDTSVVLYTIQDGGHIWFNESIGGEAPNQILWRFLSRYNLNGLTAE